MTEERDLVKYYNGEPVYVKGILQPTRCIGDFVLKVCILIVCEAEKRVYQIHPSTSSLHR